MKKAFTMVELVFVIVILGILASVAMTKLSVTRDDALVTTCTENVRMLIDDLKNHASTQGGLPQTPYTFTNTDFNDDNTTIFTLNISGVSSFSYKSFGYNCGRKRDLSLPPSVLVAALKMERKCSVQLTAGASSFPSSDFKTGEVKIYVIDTNSTFALDKLLYNRLTEIGLTQQPIVTGTGYETGYEGVF